jgi:Fic family protein
MPHRLRTSPIGDLVPVSGRDPRSGEWVSGEGYVPHPLTRTDITLSTATWTGVTAATAALARLDGATRRLRNPDLVREPLLKREAQSTSALEGTFVPFDQVLGAPRDQAPAAVANFREVINYTICAQRAFALPIEQRLTIGLLCELQGILVRGTPSEHRDAGQLRDRAVLIGSRGGGFSDARFIPGPPGIVLEDGVRHWLDWINDPPEIPSVVAAAMAHYQFETLHPFSDGNGRIGRLIAAVQLMRSGTLRDPVLVLSPWFEARREDYQSALFHLSLTGEWEPWVAFFAQGVRASAVDTTRRIDQLFELGERWAEIARRLPGRAAPQIVELLTERPIVTAPEVAERLGLNALTARNALNELVEAGVLGIREPARRGRTQVYFADATIEILSAGMDDG